MDERYEVFQQRRLHLRDEIQQLFLDAEHWNASHPDEEPIDADPSGVLAQMTDELNAAIIEFYRRAQEA